MKNSILRAFYVVDGFEQWYSGSMLFLFENKKRHPCKFLLELQALMSSPEKEGFELPTSSANPADDYAVPPLQNCNKGRSDSGFAVFSMGKEISFLFLASPAPRSGSVFFLFENKKKTSTFVDVFTGEGGI